MWFPARTAIRWLSPRTRRSSLRNHRPNRRPSRGPSRRPNRRPGRRSSRSRPLAALLLVFLAGSGCSSSEGTGDKGYVSGDGRTREIAAANRGEPVELAGEDLAGKPLSLADFRGRPLVVVVWWSGCGPCQKEAPEVVEAADELGASARFVGINIRDVSAANGQAFERDYKIPYRSFYSSGGVELLAFDRAVGPRTVPAFVVLDAEGRIAASVIGEIGSARTLVALVEDISESADE
jgi:thiol-disulfide isomerase/thioredoxin